MKHELGLLTEVKKEAIINMKPCNSHNHNQGFCLWWPTLKPFVNGGAAAFLASASLAMPFTAAYFLFPRLRPSDTAFYWAPKYQAIIKRMPSTLFIEATHATARLGSFEILRRKALAANDGMPLAFHQEVSCGLLAGVFGATITTPLYLAYLRMPFDIALPATQCRNYGNVFHVLRHMIANEGFPALWKNSSPLIKGFMLHDMGMLASYNRSIGYFKESLDYGEREAQLGASAVSAFFATACCLPYGIVMMHLLAMEPNAKGRYPYTSALDCAIKLLKSRGPLVFFTGFPVVFACNAPRVMLGWMILEQIRKLQGSIGL